VARAPGMNGEKADPSTAVAEAAFAQDDNSFSATVIPRFT